MCRPSMLHSAIYVSMAQASAKLCGIDCTSTSPVAYTALIGFRGVKEKPYR